MYSAYKEWAEKAGERPVSATIFGQRVSENYPKVKTSAGLVYQGVGLLTEDFMRGRGT